MCLLAPPWLAAGAGIWASVNLQLADLGDGGREDGQRRSGGGAQFGEVAGGGQSAGVVVLLRSV